ncbi:MAG: hypothetical protein O7F08_05120, partial [Deltaproteobacteria bacterium]|nr:hypothetical protein [Deltaproteobacteria bacterium]
GSEFDVSDRVVWDSSNPDAFPITDEGLAEAAVTQGASDATVSWRTRRGVSTLQVGAPLPKQFKVRVSALRLYAAYSCDSATTADGREGDFSFEFTIILADGTRVPVQSTPNYPDKDETILVDQGDTTNLDGEATVQVLDYQSIEVELRVTEWDRFFEDFGDFIPDADMDDASVKMIHRGAEGFDTGGHTIGIEGSSGNCEIEIDYSLGTRQL